MSTRGYRHRHQVVFEETNLVGNVYFSHYLRWQGHCREQFLLDHAPGVVAALQSGGLALVTVSVHVDYFDEAFAGDVVDVVMYQEEQVGSRVAMRFDYEREGHLVARGAQTVMCVQRTASGSVEPVPVPPELRLALDRFPRTREPLG